MFRSLYSVYTMIINNFFVHSNPTGIHLCVLYRAVQFVDSLKSIFYRNRRSYTCGRQISIPENNYCTCGNQFFWRMSYLIAPHWNRAVTTPFYYPDTESVLYLWTGTDDCRRCDISWNPSGAQCRAAEMCSIVMYSLTATVSPREIVFCIFCYCPRLLFCFPWKIRIDRLEKKVIRTRIARRYLLINF